VRYCPAVLDLDLADRLHQRWVHARRVRVLSSHFAPLLAPGARVLDVGAGDGRLAAQLTRLRPDLEVRCLDVKVRPTSAFPVETYDGRRIPYGDRAFDAVLLVDVLHHVDDPMALLAEACRVGSLVLVKDHALEGWLADSTLRFMDWVGNARYGIPLPFRYWSRSAWVEAFDRLKLDVRSWRSALGIYPWPATLLFDRGLHFVASLRSADDRART
jgi:SAM-dependent methyltransferase